MECCVHVWSLCVCVHACECVRITVGKGAGNSVVPTVRTEAPSSPLRKATLGCPCFLEAC